MPLEVLVAQTQGQIGYMIEATLDSEFMALERNHQIPMVSLITYVAVEADDPAFKKPTKPIGPVFSESRAGSVSFTTVKTPKGYRRVVASPKPVTIIEKKEIKKLIGMDFIVICCGGGGIPVIRNGRKFSGIDAVIDKDLASAKLAEEVGVDILLIATDVPGVALNYGEPNERFLPTLTIARAEQHMKSGHFPEGSIGPKVEAAVQFIQNGGKRAVITSLDAIEAAVAGKVGTQFLA
jgi:carbamate kinase